jgi:hypothetical protein
MITVNSHNTVYKGNNMIGKLMSTRIILFTDYGATKDDITALQKHYSDLQIILL